MNRMASMQVGAVLASVAMAFAGCSCDQPATCDNSDLTVAFVSPMEGAMVDQTSNVQVSLSRKGAPVNIGTAKLEVRGPGATDFTDKGNGTADGATATFTGVMLAAGENALRATVAEANCNGSAAPKTIVVTAKSTVTPPPVIVSCTFPQDANGDGTLNAAELPTGTAVSVRVLTTNGAGATFSAPGSNPAMAPIVNETATIAVPGPTADGTFTVPATVTRGTMFGEITTCFPMIRVQRTAGCTVENTTSQAPRGPRDDADRMAAGYQVRATAQLTAGTIGTAELVAAGVNRSIAFAMGVASADFTVPSTGTSSLDVVLNAFDTAGNRCTTTNGTRIVPLDFEAPTVTITSPADGATIAMPTATVTATIAGAPNGSTCQFFINGADGPTGTVMNGMFSQAVSFAGNGTYTIRADCTDAAGNLGSSATTLADGGVREHVVIVQLPANICSIVFASIGGQPASCPAFANRLGVNGVLSVVLTPSANCTMQPVRLFKDGVAVSGSGPGFVVPVGATTAMFTLRAEIDNLTGAMPAVTTTTCAVEVNTNTPVITNPVAPVAGPAIIKASDDTNSGVAGAQRQLSFTAAVPPMGRVDVCVDDVMVAGVGAQPCPGPTGWFVLATNVTSPVPAFTFPEGAYQMKIVVINAGTPPPESPHLEVLVDVTIPCVSSAGISLPQDMSTDGGSGDGRLNIAELNAADPRLRFAVDPGCGTAASAIVKNVSAGVVGSTAYSTVLMNPTGSQNIDLTTNVAAEQDLTVFVELTDGVGNRNTLISNAFASRWLRVDRAAPACTFTSPATGRTLNSTDIPTGSLGVQVQTSSDVPVVSITEGAGTQQIVPNASFIASTTVPVSGTRAVNLSATCRDSSGNAAAPAARTVNIDLDPPSFTLSAPATGFMSNSTQVTATASMVTGADGNAIVIRSSAQVSDLGTLTQAGGYTASLAFPIGMNQTITATVADNAGNTATRTATNVSISSTNCQIALTATNGQAPFVRGSTTWLNRSHVPGAGASSGTATINVNSSNCRLGELVTLARVTPPSGPTIPAGGTASNGDVSFANVALADGEVWSVTIQNNPTPVSFSVDLVAPTLTGGAAGLRINADTAAPAASVFFVAAQNNLRVRTSTPGYYPDGDGNGANGGQANFAVNGVTGAVNGSVGFSVAGMPIPSTSQSVTTSPQAFTLNAVTLAQNLAGEFAVVVTDEGGNTVDVYRGPIVVDVVPPSAPTGLDGGVLDARAATGSVAWTNDSVDDEGAPTSGAAARYVIRWTTSSVFGNNAMATSDDFFGASAADAVERAPAGTQMAENITLPPLNTYYLGVRARDEVFNYSTFSGPVTRDNQWTRVKLDGPTGTNFGNAIVAESSLNNDGVTDLVVGASTSLIAGAVYVYYGGSGLSTQPICVSPACTVINNPDAGGLGFGSDFSARGNVDTDAGTPVADLLIGQTNFPNSSVPVGRAFLYFGSASTTIDVNTFIEFRGFDNSNRIGNSTKILPDLNGDGFSEVALATPFANGNNGRILIYAGRSRADWQSARTATDPVTMAPFIPVSNATATWVVEGGVAGVPTTTGYFGRNRFGISGLGDLDGDGRGDFTVGLGPATINRMQIFTSNVIAPATPNSSALQTVSQPVGTDANTQTGFSSFVVGGVNVINGSAQDLIATWPSRAGGGAVFLYADLTAAGAPASATFTIEGPLTFGSAVGVSNLNTADTRPDLVIGTNATTNSSAWIVWQQASTAFDTPLSISVPRFWQSRVDGNTLSGSTNNSIGRSCAAADVTGEGLPDVVMADERNNTIYVWR
ncbi:MAG: Ig-like domain-containing protein [Myxococcales bacterium]|nr:Ig-like domain-containing protein [Myxococcales bacterium]